MRKIFTAALLLCSLLSKAQTFSWSGYSPIVSNIMDTLHIPVSGLPTTIDQNFGLSKVCFEIRHTDKTQLNIILVAPNGNSIILVEGQGSAGDDFIGTCVAMDGVPFQAGTPPYSGTFLPTGNLSNFNSGIDPNGDWLLVTFDNSPDTGSLRFASITFSNNPPQGNGLGGNNLGPQGPFIRGGLQCPGGISGCELLPDMTASALEIQTSMVEMAGRIEVGNSTPNIGYGPLEIYAIDSCFCNGVPQPCALPCPAGQNLTHMLRQRIYRKIPGTDTLGFYDRDAGQMTYHPGHGHLHVDHWADFTLRKATADPDPRNWPIIGTSVKQSYCLINLASCPNRPGICLDNSGNPVTNFPNYDFGFESGCSLNQGIFPGKYDIYSRGLNEPILLNGVCNGDYYIVSITDPNNLFLESDETNNVAVVPIRLSQQNPTPIITASRTSGEICSGDSIILTSNEQVNYLWSTGETTRSIVVRNAGTYTVSYKCDTVPVNSQPFTVTIVPSGGNAEININITSGTNPSCSATPITFTAASVNAGSSPTYQWKVDGVNVGANSPVFTSMSLTNGQKVTCVITSSITCLANVSDTSNEITISRTPQGGIPTLTTEIVRGTNPQCTGDTLEFKAVTTNTANVSYQWKVDGINVGSNSDVFTTASLTNGQKVTCEISLMEICPAKYVFGNGTVLNSAQSVVGAGYPTYYGNGRQQYLIKAGELTALGVTAGNISSLGFSIGDVVGNPDTLTGYTIKIGATNATEMTTLFQTGTFTTVYGPVDYLPVLNSMNTHYFSQPFTWDGTSNIIIDICFATGQYGTASYQNYMTYAPFNATSYFRQDNAPGLDACTRATATATTTARPDMIFGMNEVRKLVSDPITISSNSPAAPSVSISMTEGDNPQCPGSSVSFIATPDNTGAGPSYQWMKNNVTINGATGNTYTVSGLVQSDTIRCRMITGNICSISQNVMSNKFGIDIALPVYTFTGSGNWNNPANWLNGKMPPAKLLSCSEIVVAPVGSSESILNVPQLITPGAKLTIMAGKKFRVIGNMLVNQ